MMTGAMPSRIGKETNESKMEGAVPPRILENSLGRVFANAGYEAVYGGKVHLPMEIEAAGFKYFERDERQ